jgi:hypothetical protein
MAAESTRRLTVGSAVLRWPYVWLLLLSAVAFGAVLYLTSYKDFYFDEWDFIISRRPWNLQAFLLPRLYYMTAIPILIWKLLFLAFGLRSYIPYEATLLVFHVAAVLLFFTLVRKHSGDLPAFAASLILLFFGTGSYNIVFAFQITYVIPIAFGLLALLLIQDTSYFYRRVAAISLALTAGLMCHTVTLAFVAAIVVEAGLDPRRRRLLLSLALPAIAFGAWYLAFNTSGVAFELQRGPAGSEMVLSLVSFVLVGVAAAAAGAFGLASQAGIAVLASLVVFLAWSWTRQGKIEGWQLGTVVGLVTFFVLTGLGRLQFGVGYASQTRYLYAGAVFLLPLIAHAVRELPWRGLWRPALGLVFVAALLSNIIQLRDAARSQIEFMKVENAELQTTEFFRGAPDMAMSRFIDDGTMWALRAGDYLAARDELGSPVPPLPDGKLGQLPSWAVDRVMVNLFGDALNARPATASAGEAMPCQEVDTSSGSEMDFKIPHGQPLVLQPSKSGKAFLFLGFMNAPSPVPVKTLDLVASTPVQIYLPDTGKPVIWQLRIQTLDLGTLQVCSQVAHQVRRLSQYSDVAAAFTLGSGWTYGPDEGATTHWAAKATAGTPGLEGAYDNGFVPARGAYDVWYRVRVGDNSGKTPEMVLAVVDLDAGRYVASTTLRPNQVRTSYTWVLVASSITPTSGHHVRFQTNVASRLSTDWYLDQVLMVPAGTPAPPSI